LKLVKSLFFRGLEKFVFCVDCSIFFLLLLLPLLLLSLLLPLYRARHLSDALVLFFRVRECIA